MTVVTLPYTLTNGNTASAAEVMSNFSAITTVVNGSPYFRAYRSSAVSYATLATVVFNTETDPNGWYSTSTGVFTPTVAGTYRLSWAVKLSTTLTVDNYFSTSLVTPDGGRPGNVAWQRNADAGVVSGGSALVAFNGTTDTAYVALTHDNGGLVALVTSVANSHFEGEYVGA